MLTKKFIFKENEEEKELTDFQKILALNKGKIDPSEVEFVDSNGNRYDDIIEVGHRGIYFKFDGVDEYLQFLFPPIYSEEFSTDGYYDSRAFDSMYNRRWDWIEESNSNIDDDWTEGYVIQSFNLDTTNILKEILDIVSPELARDIIENGKMTNKESVLKQTAAILNALELERSISERYTYAYSEVYELEVPKLIENTYCNYCEDIGFETLSCFWKYEMDFASAILIFARFGTEESNFLDLFFDAVDKIRNKSHLGEVYEVRYNVWNQKVFDDEFNTPVKKLLEDKLYDIQFSDEYGSKYWDVIKKISKLGGFDNWIYSKDRSLYVKLRSVDPETLKVTYLIGKSGVTGVKNGETDIKTIINLLYNKSLFDLFEK